MAHTANVREEVGIDKQRQEMSACSKYAAILAYFRHTVDSFTFNVKIQLNIKPLKW